MNQKELTKLRDEIDELDKQIVALLANRIKVVEKVMVLKDDEETVRSCDRVQQVLDKVKLLANEQNADGEIIGKIYERIIEVLTDMQLKYLYSKTKKS